MQNNTYDRHHRVTGCIEYFKNIFKFIVFGSKIKPPQSVEFDKKTIFKQLSESILFISKQRRGNLATSSSANTPRLSDFQDVDQNSNRSLSDNKQQFGEDGTEMRMTD